MLSKTTGASVAIRGYSKSYGSFVAVEDVAIDIGAGEFIALLGPSGSGKSTILMSIAGFEAPTAGQILLDGRDITAQQPHQRNIGVVFQKYALFPHLTVAENVAYPLRRRSVPRDRIEQEVRRALEMVNLGPLAARFPGQLSGGQQQRVAVARAIVFRPPLLLMDEPLGALDRKLRQQMQMELKLLHRDLGTTIIMVTHDQEEALSMADRVVVMNFGRVEQIGTPSELYETPRSAFVADFIGDTNLLPARVLHRNSTSVALQLDGTDIRMEVPASQCMATGERALLGIRPEHVRLTDSGGIAAQEIERAFGGSISTLLLEVAGNRVTVRTASSNLSGSQQAHLIALPPERCRLYERDT